ncbi:MAG: hypothetical protein ACRDYE_05080 [Acidimicrobiales bacterium]
MLDGALQLQSFMFTKGFAHGIIAPAASGQPFFVAVPVEWNARAIGAHPVILNGFCASVQLALGVSLLVRRTARVAIVGSVLWAGGIWFLGEGLGGLAGGHTTALLGAPGAALLYVVLALAAWPSSPEVRDTSRQRPPRWVLGGWAVLWVGFAGLSVLPSNAQSGAMAGQLKTNASMVPSWLASLDRGLASGVHALGSWAVIVTVTIELAVGLLVLRPGPLRAIALWTGITVAGLYWGAGQSFGQLFSGQATDPDTGPLVILLGLVALGASRSPGQSDSLPMALVERAGECRPEPRAA